MKTFQQPLSAKDEACYLQIMQSEDRQAALEARRILIERNLRLVAHVAKKYAGAGEEMEDLISIGTIGLIKAISTFRPEKGSRLATYAAKCIDNELLMMFRARKKTMREISLYEPIGTDKEGNEINLLEVCVQEQVDVVERLDTSDKLRALNLSEVSSLSTTSTCSCTHTSNRLISFPSLSVPIGSYSEISLMVFFLARNIISNSLSMHFAAYVASLLPFSGLNVEIALISPIVPMDIRSSISSPAPAYFLATCATRRRFLSINIRRASKAACLSSLCMI